MQEIELGRERTELKDRVIDGRAFSGFHKETLLQMMRLRERRRSLQNSINQKIDGVENTKIDIDTENKKLEALLYEKKILKREIMDAQK